MSPPNNVFQYQPPIGQRQPRDIRDVNEAKAQRRAEIERRSIELDPPIPSKLLAHMDSFRAAIQIPNVLRDRDWEILKPRLVAQLEIAERREHDKQTEMQRAQQQHDQRKQQEIQSKEAKENLDRAWDDVQKPVRDRMALYADEIISAQWRNGEALTRDMCPKFSADVLMYIRNRFYNDLAVEDAANKAAGRDTDQDPSVGPPTRTLILDNVKWIFDTKIKPLTEQHQKEVFLCNRCDNNKYYGFEGVVQHYAAKHTNVLSMGNVVVHWKAEWPDPPPFNPNPGVSRPVLYGPANQGAASGVIPPVMPVPNHAAQGIHPPMLDPSHRLQQEAGPMYPPLPSPGAHTRQPYGSQYSGFPPGQHFRPPSPHQWQSPAQLYQPLAQAYGHSNRYSHGYNSGHSGPQGQGSYEGYNAQPHNSMYGSPYPGAAYPVLGPQSMPTPTYGPPSLPAAAYEPGRPSYGQGFPPQTQYPHSFGPPNVPAMQSSSSQPSGIYQVQMDEVGNVALDIWNHTSGVKDLVPSIRLHVIIHHVVLNFKNRFTNEPSLSMFMDGLNTLSQMSPLKTMESLGCKACVNPLFGARGVSEYPHPPSATRKVYALPGLLSHFQSVHIERAKPAVIPLGGMETSRLDWKVDMVDLPDGAVIVSLIYALGMNNDKLRLIADAFPGVFSSPLPSVPISQVDEYAVSGTGSGGRDLKRTETVPMLISRSKTPYRPESQSILVSNSRIQSRALSPHAQRLEVAVDDFPRFLESPGSRSTRTSEPPGEDEYDPARPYIEPHGNRFMGQEIRTQHARFATRDRLDAPNRRERSTVSRVEHRNLPSEAISRASNLSHMSTPPPYNRKNTKQRDHTSRSKFHDSKRNRQTRDGSLSKSTHYQFTKLSPDKRPPSKVYTPVNMGPNDAVPKGEISAAEKFLNEFQPGLGTSRARPVSSHREESRAGEEERERTTQTEDKYRSLNRIVDAHPTVTAESNSRGSPMIESHTSIGYRPYDPKREKRPVSQGGRRIDHSPKAHAERYDRTVTAYGNRHVIPQDELDSQDRYENYQHATYRPRSRSPRRELGSSYYRSRSPEQKIRYRGQSPQLIGGPVEADEPTSYRRIPTQRQYKYVDEPDIYVPEYDSSVNFVRISREPQPGGPYLVQRPMQQSGYIRYQDDIEPERVYEKNGQLYRAAPAPSPEHQVRYRRGELYG